MMTFKSRVREFWGWYAQVAERFYHTIQEGECSDLTQEVSDFMNRVMPGLSWAFGPGIDGAQRAGHSFTLSGQGELAKQLLAQYWCSQAPDIRHWSFYGSRQPTAAEDLKGVAIQISGEEQVDVERFALRTTVDDESQCIDILAWHPALQHVPEEHHLQILFLLLDEALGEFGTQMWLGTVAVEPFTADEKSKWLYELPKFIEQVNAYHRWEKTPPLDCYTLYEINAPSDTPRGDTVVGSTCIPSVVFDLLEHEGKLPEDPFEGLGAEFAYVAIDGAVFPEGGESEVRGNIEDALGDALEDDLSGRTLGGAFGARESYVDLLLLDGVRSREIVQSTLSELQLDGRARIESYL